MLPKLNISKLSFYKQTTHLVDSIIWNVQFTMDVEDSFSIPPNLFDEDKPFISTDIPFCEKNENNSKDFIENSTISQIENIALDYKHTWTRKNMEGIYIALIKPSLNNRLKFNKLLLFRNYIT